jgi:hypothetical protein
MKEKKSGKMQALEIFHAISMTNRSSLIIQEKCKHLKFYRSVPGSSIYRLRNSDKVQN